MRRVLAQVLAVAEGDASQPVDSHDVLVELTYFDYDAGTVPLCGIRAQQVLHPHAVADGEWGQNPCVLGEPLVRPHVSDTQCVLPRFQCLAPRPTGQVLSGWCWYEVTDSAPEDDFCGADLRHQIWCVSVG